MNKATPQSEQVKPASEWTDGLLWALAEKVRAHLVAPLSQPAPSAEDKVIRFPIERRSSA